MSKLYDNAPSIIEIPFEYDIRTPYYSLEHPEIGLARVAAEALYELIEENLDDEHLKNTTITYHVPTDIGWTTEWRLPALEFYNRAELVEIT